jgi:serine/threonine-protein kinase
MAPESLTGGKISARADVYALGLVAYELLAGRHPFADRDRREVIAAQLSEIPEHLDMLARDLPAGVADVVARALAKPPRLRQGDAGVFQREWRAAFGLSATTNVARAAAAPVEREAHPTETALSMRHVATSRRLSWHGLAAVLVGALGLAWWAVATEAGAHALHAERGIAPRRVASATAPPAQRPFQPARAAPAPLGVADASASTPPSLARAPARPANLPARAASASEEPPASSDPAEPDSKPPLPPVDERIGDYLEE